MTPAVRIQGVSRRFLRRGVGLPRSRRYVDALIDVNLEIPAGSRFGIVGESGSGKTTMMRLIAALDAPTNGTVEVDGLSLAGRSEAELRPLRGRLQMVFQDPMGSLDPRMTVGNIVAEPLRAQGNRETDALVEGALADVGLEPDVSSRYPHQFSGGQRQRISIARAIAPRPRILIADEPVSALDVTIRAQVLALLTEIAARDELTLIFVSHDLAVVRQVCDEVAVLRAGRVVETGPTETVYRSPAADYTRELLAAVPTLERSLAAAQARLEAKE